MSRIRPVRTLAAEADITQTRSSPSRVRRSSICGCAASGHPRAVEQDAADQQDRYEVKGFERGLERR